MKFRAIRFGIRYREISQSDVDGGCVVFPLMRSHESFVESVKSVGEWHVLFAVPAVYLVTFTVLNTIGRFRCITGLFIAPRKISPKLVKFALGGKHSPCRIVIHVVDEW